MTQINFEGDVENFNTNQLKFIENVLIELGYDHGKVLVEAVGQKGDNYAATVKRLIIHKSNGMTLKIIAKVAPSNEITRIVMNTEILFQNEGTMYQKVLPKLEELLNNAGVPENERINIPKCYGVLIDPPHEIILLEDMNEEGFEMLDRFQSLTNETMRVALKSLAIFHSLSFALKNTDPSQFQVFSESLRNLWAIVNGDPNNKAFMEMTENQVKALMDTERYKTAITGILTQIDTQFKKLQSYETDSKYSVVLQGDCWTNNILFRLEEGNAVQNVMIDYQISREGNPAADVLYMILNCTDYSTRSKHYQNWIEYYHEQLDNSLANFGLKSTLTYSRDQLDADLKRYGKLNLGLAVMLSSMLMRDSKDVVDFGDIKESNAQDNVLENVMDQMKTDNLNMSSVIRVRDKVTGILDTGLELGFIATSEDS